jgi:hypothetical protein
MRLLKAVCKMYTCCVVGARVKQVPQSQHFFLGLVRADLHATYFVTWIYHLDDELSCLDLSRLDYPLSSQTLFEDLYDVISIRDFYNCDFCQRRCEMQSTKLLNVLCPGLWLM